jgi:hypothetical protein
MNRYLLERPTENPALLPSPLRHPFARRQAKELERRRQIHDQELAWRVQEVLVGRGLTQNSYSIGGGRTLRIPQVIAVTAGPPVALDVRILPGQMPDEFAAHTSAIAYNLGVAEVRVVPLGPSLIQLVLLSATGLITRTSVEEPDQAIEPARTVEHEERSQA